MIGVNFQQKMLPICQCTTSITNTIRYNHARIIGKNLVNRLIDLRKRLNATSMLPEEEDDYDMIGTNQPSTHQQ